ncbi:glycosyltransferase [bacterium]|nr:glycosyltransferase [bacterium]
MQLSIIIVSYNVKYFLEQALTSVQKAITDLSAEVFVVDNASQDDSITMVRDQFPAVHLVANTTNQGFGAANNQAVAEAKGDFIVFLNPDTIVQEDTFSTMLRFFETRPDAGMAGCKILNPDGTLQLACRRSFPTPWVAFTKVSGLSRFFPKSRLFGRYNLTFLNPDECHEVEAISGSFMVARSQALAEVGGFDETWFMYGEDLDLCYRFREKGWKIFYVPDTKIIHFKGESSRQSEFDTIRLFYQAMRIFVSKYHQSWLMQFFLDVGIALRAVIHFGEHILQRLAIPLIDFALMNLSLVLALMIRFGNLGHWRSYLVVTAVYSSIWLLLLYFMSCQTRRRYSFGLAFLAVLSGIFINAALTFFVNSIAYSRIVVLIAGLLNLLLLPGWRLIAKLLPYRNTAAGQHRIWGRKTLIIGSGPAAQKIAEKLRHPVAGGYQVVGMVSFITEDLGREVGPLRVLGTITNLEAIIRRQNIRELIFSTENTSYDKILEVMSQGRGLGVNYRIVPDNLEVIIGKSSIDELSELPLVEIDSRIDQPSWIVGKRLLDLVLSTLALVFTGPWIFWQRWIRKQNWHFQTIVGAEGMPVPVRFFNHEKFGRWAFLPLLTQVWRGRMSLVGSEIITFNEGESHPAWKIAIKPGLTGLLQIAPEKKMTEEDKQRYYLYYIKNYSLLLDFEIMLKTLLKR